MRNLIPVSQVEKMLEEFKDKVKESLLNAIEEPMTTAEAWRFLGYSTRKALQDDLKRVPHHKAANGKRYFFPSELNAWIKLHAIEGLR
jgi:hypothetical protein